MHASSQAKENLAPAKLLLAGRRAGRDGRSLNPAWPGGERGLFHWALPGSLGAACSEASLRVVVPGEKDPRFQRAVFVSKRISVTASPVL